MTILNSSAYRFIPLSSNDLPDLKSKLLEKGQQLSLKGTILLSPEGINLSLAGPINHLEPFKLFLLQLMPALKGLAYNETYSSYQPFQHLFIKIKKQISTW